MKGFTKLGRTLLVLTVLFILPLSDAMSQKFIMETGTATYNATCSGVIKLKAVSAVPAEKAEIVRNNSNLLGTNETNAIKGIVEWAGATATQEVQGIFYEKMMLSGAANKTILDGVNIVGEACTVGSTLPGYTDFETYPFFITGGQIGTTNDFQGTFTYLGGPVKVFPVTDNDSYNNLAMNGAGPYTMPDATVTTIDGTIALPAIIVLNVDGELNTGLASSIAGIVNVDNGGSINIGTTVTAGDHDITFDGNITLTDGTLKAGAATDGKVIIGSGSTLDLAETTGIIDFAAGTFLDIEGAMTNGGDGTNVKLFCTSTVTYNSTTDGQIIMPTINSNPYGNLVLEGAEKVGGEELTYAAFDQNNIAICANFSLADGNLDMVTKGGYVNMLNQSTTDVDYTGLSEVVGSFRREFTNTATGPYTFNNSGTALTYSVAPDPAGFYQLNIQGGVPPINFVPGTDINRRIIPSYAGIGDIEYKLKVAYLESELPTFASGLTEADLKYFEANASGPLDVEKLAGTGYSDRSNATALAFGTLAMSGIIDGAGGPIDGIIEREFAPGHDLVLRANNTMYSIAAGRWSNPDTWDEGRTPVATDNVEVRNFVYVGIDAGAAAAGFAGTLGGPTDDNSPIAAKVNRRSESQLYTNSPGVWHDAARTITIANGFNGALVIGNEDNDDDYVFKTSLAEAGSFLNANLAGHTLGLEIATGNTIETKAGITAGNRNGANGLWLVNLTSASKVPILSTFELKNEGAINNTGIIEVGE